MRLLFGQDAYVADWVARRIPHMTKRLYAFEYGQAFGPSTAIGVLGADGMLIAGVVYHAYDPWCRSIEMSCAAATPRWLTRDTLRALLRYIFVQLSCSRATCVTPRRATSVRKFLKGLGFKQEGLIRRGFGSDDAIILGFLASEWRRSPWSDPPPEERSEVKSLGEKVRACGAASA